MPIIANIAQVIKVIGRRQDIGSSRYTVNAYRPIGCIALISDVLESIRRNRTIDLGRGAFGVKGGTGCVRLAVPDCLGCAREKQS